MSMDKYDEYIKKVKQGDDLAFNYILENHSRIIYKVINNHNLEVGDYKHDAENLYQEGCIALYNCIFTYEANKGMSFTSYAYMVIRSRINTVIRDNTRKYENEHYSIDNYPNVDYHLSMTNLCVSENPITYHKEKEFKNQLHNFINKLSIEDKQIVEMRSDNYSYKDIAKRLCINTKRVDNRLRMLRKKLKNNIKSYQQ